MRITPLISSTFKSDGGAIFSLVPKPIWSRLIRSDSHNAIDQIAHNLLIETDDGQVGLIDTGCGDSQSYSPKQRRIFSLGQGWPLIQALKGQQLAPDDINFVIFTHLHWDHVSGASVLDQTQQCRQLTFKNATHYIHQTEWLDATQGDPVLYKSYDPKLIEPLQQTEKQICFVQGDENIQLPGLKNITLTRTGGHTQGHCAVIIEPGTWQLNHPQASDFEDCQRVVYASDAYPTQHHLHMVYLTSYDTFPLTTRRWKRNAIAQIASNNDLLLFAHDPAAFGATVRMMDHGNPAVHKALAT